MTKKSPYGWKDLLTDAAIVAVVGGVVLLIIGSFPELFSKFLPFLNKWDFLLSKLWHLTCKVARKLSPLWGENRLEVLKRHICEAIPSPQQRDCLWRPPWELKTHIEWLDNGSEQSEYWVWLCDVNLIDGRCSWDGWLLIGFVDNRSSYASSSAGTHYLKGFRCSHFGLLPRIMASNIWSSFQLLASIYFRSNG